jgi:hypothetical protein
MPLHRSIRTARALAAAACILLALAAPAGAMPADNGPSPATAQARTTAAPTVVKQTVVRQTDRPNTLALVVIGAGAVAALLGAGYLGARIATRNARLASR